MIIGAIIVGVLICALITLGDYIRDRCSSGFDAGVVIGVVITILFALEVCLVSNIIGGPVPSALDVYRGNTELEITSINGVPTDTAVVFKVGMK